MMPNNSRITQPTVLVVDDHVDTADRFADCLPDEYSADTAYTGDAALELLSDDVDVLLISQVVGPMTGESVLEAARARGYEGRAILLTDTKQEPEPSSQQFDDFLITPASRTAVRGVVERMVERDTFDTRMQEVLSIVSRMATLESKLSIDELLTSDAYARLDARLDEFRKHGVETETKDQDEYAEFSSEKLRVVLG